MDSRSIGGDDAFDLDGDGFVCLFGDLGDSVTENKWDRCGKESWNHTARVHIASGLLFTDFFSSSEQQSIRYWLGHTIHSTIKHSTCYVHWEPRGHAKCRYAISWGVTVTSSSSEGWARSSHSCCTSRNTKVGTTTCCK